MRAHLTQEHAAGVVSVLRTNPRQFIAIWTVIRIGCLLLIGFGTSAAGAVHMLLLELLTKAARR